ncbi:MAG TPA: N-acyl homoserine lactonase family protein [Gemmatimonadaceae bacterium]|nr:N-acyl homoserine lactonase family protein [Gemmatimonadaceae bacterium]
MTVKITALSTGTLQLKPTFLEGSPSHGGPFGLIWDLRRDQGWTEPLPMWCWIIETASELILIDAGARPGASGGVTRTRFEIAEDEALVVQLEERGLKPADFDRVLLTHLHGDHVGALAAFDPRRVWVSRPEWAPVAHFPGSLLRRLKAPVYRGFNPMVFDFNGPAVFGFRASCPITPDNSIVALPTPGHTVGHTSFLLRRSEGDVLIAGDVTYDLPALYAQREQGFIEDVEKHRDTLPRVLSLVQSGVAYLPSHDPHAPSRLARHSGTAGGGVGGGVGGGGGGGGRHSISGAS